MSDEQIIELGLQGAYKNSRNESSTTATGDDTTSMIKKEEGWYYPDLQKHIGELKGKWDEVGIPLDIVVEDRR